MCPNWAALDEWHMFTGDQLGMLLGHWVVSNFLQKNPGADRSTICLLNRLYHLMVTEFTAGKLVVLNSTVSSKWLAAFAKKEGLHYEACALIQMQLPFL